LLPGRSCSALFSNFVEEKNIRDNKKDRAFLLAWDRDSYTERFLALLPCTCVLNLNWFISTRPLHYFLVPLPYWPLPIKIILLVPLQWAHQTLSNFQFPSLSLFFL
jgi:hypothetical protein